MQRFLYLHVPIYICCPSSLYLQKHENFIHKWFHWDLTLSLSKEKCCNVPRISGAHFYAKGSICLRPLALLQWTQGLLPLVVTEVLSVISTDFFTRHYWGKHVINRSRDPYCPWNYENNSFQTWTMTYSKKCIYHSHSEYVLHVLCVCVCVCVCVCLKYHFLYLSNLKKSWIWILYWKLYASLILSFLIRN